MKVFPWDWASTALQQVDRQSFKPNKKYKHWHTFNTSVHKRHWQNPVNQTLKLFCWGSFWFLVSDQFRSKPRVLAPPAGGSGDCSWHSFSQQSVYAAAITEIFCLKKLQDVIFSSMWSDSSRLSLWSLVLELKEAEAAQTSSLSHDVENKHMLVTRWNNFIISRSAGATSWCQLSRSGRDIYIRLWREHRARFVSHFGSSCFLETHRPVSSTFRSFVFDKQQKKRKKKQGKKRKTILIPPFIFSTVLSLQQVSIGGSFSSFSFSCRPQTDTQLELWSELFVTYLAS